MNFKMFTPEEQVPFSTNVHDQLTVDPDVSVGSSPVTMAIYSGQIADVADILSKRKGSSSQTLTVDEHRKVNLLVNSTQSIAQFI